MLNGSLSLHDIADVESFCSRVVDKRGVTDFGYLDRDDLVLDLIVYVWRLSEQFDRRRGTAFSKFVSFALSRYIVDWKRATHGRDTWQFRDRTYHRPLPSFVSLEHRPDEPDYGELDHADAGGLQDLLGLQRARGSTGARDAEAPTRTAA